MEAIGPLQSAGIGQRGANISFRNFHFELPPFENIAPNVEVNMAIISLITWSWLIFHTHGFLFSSHYFSFSSKNLIVAQ